jgi:capsular polysaccharide transport system permease protein
MIRDFFKAASVKGRIIHALFLHLLLTEHGKSKIGYITALLKPAGQILIFSTMFTIIGRRIGIGDNVVLFLTTGIITFNLCIGLTDKILTMGKAPKRTIESTPVTTFDCSIAFLISESIITLIASFLILGGLGYFGYWDHRVDSLLGIILAALMAILLGYALGLVNLAIMTIIPPYHKVWKILTMPLFVMSGVIFLVDERFPSNVVEILSYNPILHIIEFMRSSIYRTWDGSIFDLGYVLWFTLITLFLGLTLQHLTKKMGQK